MIGRLALSAFVFINLTFGAPAYAQDEPDVKEVAASDIDLGEKPAIIPTLAFADSGDFSGASLSPDGSKIVVEVDLQGQASLVLFDAETRKPFKKFGTGGKVDLEWFQWAGNNKILFSVSQLENFRGGEVRFTRLFYIDLTTSAVAPLGRTEAIVDGDNVIHVEPNGEYLLLSAQRNIFNYPSVYKVFLSNDRSYREVQSPRDGVWDWYADNAGVVRIGSGWRGKRLRVYYRSSSDNDLELVAKFKQGATEDNFWDVAYIKAGSDEGYVLEENDAGNVALMAFDFAQGKALDTVYENENWDVTAARIDRTGTPERAFYTDDKRQTVWLNEDGARWQSLLEKALQQESVRITSQARDRSRMLVWAGGANDPGALYVFSPGTKKLDQFVEMRPKVDFRLLAKPTPVKYKARDGVDIPAYLTLPKGRLAKGLPLIILPHGGPYGVRDILRYDDEVQMLANRGYAVIQPNFRGSGGYGKEFFELGTGQIGRGMQDDLDDAMDWAVEQGFADKDRVCVVGGSYGGYAALWSVIRNPERYRCAASWAGVTDFNSQLKFDRKTFTRFAGKRWRARVEGDDDFDLDDVSPAEFGDKLNRPVLLAHGTDDSVVPYSQFKKMRNATKKAPVKPEMLVIKDEGHSFSTEGNKKQWLDTLEAFLAKHNPAD